MAPWVPSDPNQAGGQEQWLNLSWGIAGNDAADRQAKLGGVKTLY